MDDPEATSLILRTLFTIKARSTTSTARSSAREEKTMWKDPRKMTREELAAREAEHQDLMRRLKAMIEKYDRLIAEHRAAGGE
jgi:hypothetical protein